MDKGKIFFCNWFYLHIHDCMYSVFLMKNLILINFINIANTLLQSSNRCFSIFGRIRKLRFHQALHNNVFRIHWALRFKIAGCFNWDYISLQRRLSIRLGLDCTTTVFIAYFSIPSRNGVVLFTAVVWLSSEFSFVL